MNKNEVKIMINNVREQMYEDARLERHHPEFLLGAMRAVRLVESLLKEKLDNDE